MTATLPPHAAVRDCRLYRFRVYHPDDMGLPAEQRRVVIGYVGETWRWPLARLLEHVYDQPWADTIVGWDLDPRVFAGKTAVLAAEAAAIRAEKPLYNVKGNEGNRKRIPPPLAIRQRRARDAAKKDAPRWVHPDDRGTGPVAGSRVQARPVARRPWRPWQKRLLALTVTASVLTVLGWIALAYAGRMHGNAWWQVFACCTGATVWAWFGFPWFDKRSDRRVKRAWKRWRK